MSARPCASPCSAPLFGKTPQAAARAFRDSLQRSLDCAVEARLNIDGYRPSQSADLPYTADLSGGKPTPFARQSDLQLVVVRYLLIEAEDEDPGRWTTHVVRYEYALEDQNGGEILAYHWHPNRRNALASPHLHIGGAVLTAVYKNLSKAHVPTERIVLEDVLWFAMRELKAPPTRRHTADGEDAFRRGRTADHQ